MRPTLATIANGLALALAIGWFVAAFTFDRQYGQAHALATQAVENAGGHYSNARLETTHSPELYFRRAQSVRASVVTVWVFGMVVAGITKKWIPAVVVTAICLIVGLTGGVR